MRLIQSIIYLFPILINFIRPKMSFIFLLNGDFDKEYDINFFKNYNYIICIDGGYEKFLKLNLNIEPDYLIGDFDSIANMNEKTKNLPKNKIIFKDNQDESDTEFALKFILNKYTKEKISNIDFIYATSTSRIDHMLCNMLLLKQVPLNIESKIITKTQEIFLVRNKVEIKGHANRTLSVIPITNVKGLTIKGCKWELDNVDLNFGFIGGISNIVEKDPSEISVKEGECIIVISYEI